MTKEDVLLPQDAQAVDPSKLSALTPEVVSFSAARERRRQDGLMRRAAMGYGLSRRRWNKSCNEGAWWASRGDSTKNDALGCSSGRRVIYRAIFAVFDTSCAGPWTGILWRKMSREK